MDEIEHGTYSGAQKCRKRPEGRCEECRQAMTDYMREWRQKRKVRGVVDETWRTRVRARAKSRLAKLHPRDYYRLLREEADRTRPAKDS